MRAVNQRRGLRYTSRHMRSALTLFLIAGAAVPAQQQRAARTIIAPLEEAGFQKIFDGKTLNGWDADPAFWKVEDGAIVGQTEAGRQPKQNIFCIWRGGKPADFELKAQYRLTGGNSGIQYRSIERSDVAKWVMEGYQADIDAQETYTGQIYEERGRGFLALRGMFTYVGEGKKPGAASSLGDGDQLKSFIKSGDWNDIDVIARGHTLIQSINGHVMSVMVDDDTAKGRADGLIGLQLHLTTTGMKVEFRELRIKTL